MVVLWLGTFQVLDFTKQLLSNGTGRECTLIVYVAYCKVCPLCVATQGTGRKVANPLKLMPVSHVPNGTCGYHRAAKD